MPRQSPQWFGATSRFAAELGYHIGHVNDATEASSKGRMHAVHALDGFTFAHAILPIGEQVSAVPESGGGI